MDLRPYVCKQCGAAINVARMKCDYCGTAYEDPSIRRLTVVTQKPGTCTIKAEVRIDKEDMLLCPERVRDYTLRELRNQLADGLLAFMKIQTREDLGSRTEIIRGEVRVVDPIFDY